jgi:hypothetical protein
MKEVISIMYLDEAPFYYIRLGAFLQFFEEKLMYLVNVGTESTPMLKFDFEVESNIMYIDPLQVSVDPTICVVNRTLTMGYPPSPFIFAPNGDPFESPLLGKSYGQIMNIYLNMRYVLTKLDELKDANDNKVVLIDFLNNILSAVNGSLGGSTKLEAVVDDDRNTVVIIDGNPLPNLKEVIKALNGKDPLRKLSNEYAQFNLYGYTGDTAGFIKDFSFTTEITPALSTILTVGATANSAVVGENSTAFSKFNAGLTDRFKSTISQPTSSMGGYSIGNPFANVGMGNKTDDEIIIDELTAKWGKIYSEYTAYLVRLSGGQLYEVGEGDKYKDILTNLNTSYNQLLQALVNQKLKIAGKPINSNTTATTGTGFIPFNMSLTMDGLSGMKIYSKFLIDTKYLPANYPDNADFLIKGIEHKIENNKWTTNISSVVISQGTSNTSGLVNLTGGSSSNAGKSSGGGGTAGGATVKTTPSGFNLSTGAFSIKITTKTQIYLHHTAGAQIPDNGKQTVSWWNTSTAKGAPASTHAVIDVNGNIEYMFDDKYVSYHAQAGVLVQNIGLSVEIQSYGSLDQKNGKFYSWSNTEVLANQVALAVDINGNPRVYKKHSYYQKYTPAQIAAVKTLILKWSAKHNIPVKWMGQKSYDRLFPPNDGTSPDALSGAPGLYSHNSVRKDKSDVFPQQELIEMLKTL